MKTVNLPSDKKFLINSWQLGIANQMGKFYLIKVFALLWYCAHTQSTKVASSIKRTKKTNLLKNMAPQMASLSVFPLEKLPDELILNILTYFKLKDLMNCCQTSKRIRRIAQGTIHILPKHIFRPFRVQTPSPT